MIYNAHEEAMSPTFGELEELSMISKLENYEKEVKCALQNLDPKHFTCLNSTGNEEINSVSGSSGHDASNEVGTRHKFIRKNIPGHPQVAHVIWKGKSGRRRKRRQKLEQRIQSESPA